MKILELFLMFLVGPDASADSVTVTKANNTHAVVKFEGMKLEAGKKYVLSEVGGNRSRIVEVSGEIASNSKKSGTTSVSGLTLSTSIRYGINRAKTEFGGLFNYASDSRSTSKFVSFGLGGFFDYNLVPNQNENLKVYGFGSELTLGSVAVGSGSAVSFYEIFPYGFYKVFFAGSSVALNTKVGYEYVANMTSPAVTEGNMKVTLGMGFYY